MLRKRATATSRAGHLQRVLETPASHGLNRRSFLRNSGLAAGGIGAVAGLGTSMVRKAEGQTTEQGPSIERKKTVCPFCAVGCSIWAEVQNGVWIGQEPVFESPVNMGTHCAKGAATRELAIGERRLKYPTKLVGGQWQRISWEQAIDEIGDRMLQIREESGPDSVYWLGSAKFSNEAAYLCRKFAAFWGSNNVDHQARICHSTTVAGVANTFGYGAMTNSMNDIHNAKSIFLIGGNPAEAHPVSMLHLLHAKENGAKLMVIDPRFTRTAAHADEYVRVRTGTDIAFMWGVLWHIFENGWEDEAYIESRVFGMDAVRQEVQRYTPEEVERITGVARDQVERVARTFAENRPGTLIWCMGLTQSTIGNSNTRAASILQLALGNIGKSGGGANIFRGHDNVQGATDLGLLCHDLPGYYGLDEGSWRHWCRVWDVDYEWLQSPQERLPHCGPVFTEDEFSAIVGLAHQLGRKVTIHARYPETVIQAVRAGVDWIIHASYMRREDIGYVRDSGIPLCPTLTFTANIVEHGADVGVDPNYIEVKRRELDALVGIYQAAHEAGIPLLAGSESGFSVTPYGEWHAREMELMVEYVGLSSMQAIAAGTVNNARAFGWYDEVGRIAPGLRADLVVLQGDPLENIHVLGDRSQVQAVVKEGELVSQNGALDKTRKRMSHERGLSVSSDTLHRVEER